MKTSMTFKWVCVCFCASFFLACSAEDGEMGPKGPQGEVGLPGPQGEPGSANVIFSEWLTVEGSDWLPRPPATTNVHMATLNAPEITQGYIDTAVILLYGRKNYRGDNNVVPLPWSDGTLLHYSVGLITPGKIEFWLQYTDNRLFANNSVNLDFRYVIIPGGVSTSGKAPQTPINKMTYKEVRDFFGQKD